MRYACAGMRCVVVRLFVYVWYVYVSTCMSVSVRCVWWTKDKCACVYCVWMCVWIWMCTIYIDTCMNVVVYYRCVCVCVCECMSVYVCAVYRCVCMSVCVCTVCRCGWEYGGKQGWMYKCVPKWWVCCSHTQQGPAISQHHLQGPLWYWRQEGKQAHSQEFPPSKRMNHSVTTAGLGLVSTHSEASGPSNCA